MPNVPSKSRIFERICFNPIFRSSFSHFLFLISFICGKSFIIFTIKKEVLILHTEILTLSPESIAKAALVIQAGGLCAMPTETVYGLAADGLNPEAAKEIFRVKGRPQDNPLILHIANLDMLYPLVKMTPEMEGIMMELADAFWPGPLTVVLPRSQLVPDIITAGGPTVAIRMPAHPGAKALIEAAGTPIAAPSANLSGRPSPTTLRDCADDLTGLFPMILDGGDSDLTRFPLDILRAGGVGKEDLEEALGYSVGDVSAPKTGEILRSPGMKYKHYAPSTPLTALSGAGRESAAWLCEQDGDFAVICFDESASLFDEKGIPVIPYGKETDSVTQARKVFTSLREADRLGSGHLYIQLSPSKAGRGAAVYNRVFRACGGDMITL